MQCIESPLSAQSLQAAREFAQSCAFHVICNNEKNDCKRMQSEDFENESVENEILTAISAHTGTKMEFVKMKIVKSLGGCAAQILHRDYDGAQSTIDARCCSLLVPLQTDGAHLNIGTDSAGAARVHCGLGCAFFWGHDVVHGGASYESENIRLFAYITNDKKCIKNYIFD